MKKIFKKMLAAASAVYMMAVPAVPVLAANSSALPDFSGLGAIGSYTAAETQHIAEQIYTGLLNHEEAITLDVQWSTMVEWDDLTYIYRAVLSGWDAGIMTSRAYGSWGVARKGRYYYVQIVPTYLGLV